MNLKSNIVKSLTDLIEKTQNDNGETVYSNTLPDNLWANVMRQSIENKNLLAERGAIYVGTGKVTTVVTGEKDTEGDYIQQEIARTSALTPPLAEDAEGVIAERKFLATDNVSDLGVGWRSIEMADLPQGEEGVAVKKSVTALTEKVDNLTLQTFGLSAASISVVTGDWLTAAENAPGKYYKSITVSETLGADFAPNGEVYVQLMMNQSFGTNSGWSIVNSSIEIVQNAEKTDTVINIYSNIQFAGKILLLGMKKVAAKQGGSNG